ncbi:hypothetical protein STH675 [Symbiobacterium thermophilum IAM 14863]|uniref:Uncharacterized protein n=1 Tax=Symbiobacterium thermophilum (strain DSM 24528 / JCM 14929 / IAM 14863 / T) TaxID=292459 RepID=Q67RN3_SYMTH|nr:hypothetical protein STH675 [Symbiobacterium thermophilum IAM 14863]
MGIRIAGNLLTADGMDCTRPSPLAPWRLTDDGHGLPGNGLYKRSATVYG